MTQNVQTTQQPLTVVPKEGLPELTEFFEQAFMQEPVDRVTIQHVGHTGPSQVQSWKCGATDPEKLARQTLNIIDRHSAVWTRKSSYIVEVIGENAMNPFSQFPISREPNKRNALSESEPANEHGMFSQGMRHLEAMARTYIHGCNLVMERYERLSTAQEMRNRSLEDRENQVSQLNHNLLVESVDAENRRERSKQRGQVEAKALEEVVKVLPYAFHHMLMKMSGKDGKQAAEYLGRVQSFAQSLNPEQFDKISDALTAPQLRALKQLLGLEETQTAPEEKAAETTKEEVPHGSSSP